MPSILKRILKIPRSTVIAEILRDSKNKQTGKKADSSMILDRFHECGIK